MELVPSNIMSEGLPAFPPPPPPPYGYVSALGKIAQKSVNPCVCQTIYNYSGRNLIER